MKYDKQGRELPDPTPLAIPAELKRRVTQEDRLQVMLQADRRSREYYERMDTLDEHIDTADPDDQDDFLSPYEEDYPGQFEDDQSRVKQASKPKRKKKAKVPKKEDQVEIEEITPKPPSKKVESTE